MFQQPTQSGDQVKIPELLGSLVLIYAHEIREGVTTPYGEKDPIEVTLHVLDGAKAGESYEHTLIFQGVLIGALRGAIGGDPVLGRVGQGIAKPGQSAPFVLNPFTDADAAIATAWINSRPKFGQPANPTTGAASAAATTTAASTPVSAAPAPANGMTAEAFQGLPPEVQELLRKTSAGV